MDHETTRATIIPLGDEGEDLDQIAEDMREGLLGEPKDLSPWPKYRYDEKGSEIFEEITVLPEYYQSRTELSILEENALGIVSRTGCRELVELGSGSSSKTRILLDAMTAANMGAVSYVPLDISESALATSAKRLLEEYPTLEISGFVGDFERSLERLLGDPRLAEGSGRLVIFLGNTIANITPERRRSFLSTLRTGLKEGDYLLVGFDLVKDAHVLEAAYDDAAGVTARFNKNLLNVLNRKLGAKFDPELFAHRAVYDTDAARIEMWLDSKVAQKVPVAALGLEVPFEAGEGMRTDISAKFTRESVGTVFAESGLELVDFYADDEDQFGLALGASS
jgi:L-histidine Nalpha-methyltransferase